MSVKLIVVALLAAATTVSAQNAAKVATVKTCTDGCECTSTLSNTKKYPVDTCVEGDNKHWKVEQCPATSEGKIILKGYSTNTCQEKTKMFPQCKIIDYLKATCNAQGNKASITITGGCAESNCESTATGCQSTTFNNNNDCQTVGRFLYKLKTQLSSECTSAFEFTRYENPTDCFNNENGVSITLQADSCSVHNFQKATCGSGKVSFEICTNAACNSDCKADSKTADIPVGTYTDGQDGETLYLDSCPTDSAQGFTFQVYDGVKQYTQGCDAAANTEATCAEPAESTTTTESTTTAESTTTGEPTTTAEPTTTTGETSDNSNESNNSNEDNSSGEITGHTGGDGNTIVHTVGALALVLGVLACMC